MKKLQKQKKSIIVIQKISQWFGHETSEIFGFHKDVVINQRKLLFKFSFASVLTFRLSDTPWYMNF